MQKPDSHLYLVDGSGYIFRAFYGLPPMSRSDGTPVNAVYGFCTMLLKLMEASDADYLGVVFDTSRVSFRQSIYADYKANRQETPEELIPQFPLFREAVTAFGLKPIELDGYEADDLIASYTNIAKQQNIKVTIVSSDKDLMQLVNDDANVEMLDPMKNKLIRHDEVLEKFGVAPERVIDVQSLAGDSSDNVPGVPGIGIKTAALLINEYGDLDNLLARSHDIKQNKRRENLIEYAPLARISRQLVTLAQNVDVPIELSALRRQDPIKETLLGFFQSMEFKSLGKRLSMEKLGAGNKSMAANVSKNADIPLPSSSVNIGMDSLTNANDYLGDISPQLMDFSNLEYDCITDMATLNKWVDKIYQYGWVAVDTETTSLQAVDAELVGISLAVEAGKAAYIPLKHKILSADDDGNSKNNDDGKNLPMGDLFASDNDKNKTEKENIYRMADNQLALRDVLSLLKPILEDDAILKIGQNIKYDMILFKKHGIMLAPIDDTMLLSFVLNAGKMSHGMDELSRHYLQHSPIKFTDITGSGKAQITFDKVAVDVATNYAAEDADITLRLYQILSHLVKNNKLWEFYQYVERPLPPIIADMEIAGVRIDDKKLQRLSTDFAERLKGLEEKIHSLAGEEFNVASPKQLGEILFEKMDIKGGKKTKSGTWATNADILEKLKYDHEIVDLIVNHRMLAKLKNTYSDALPMQISKNTNRVHTHFMMTGAQTGRLSSTDPNVQNIPIRTVEGREIRKCFISKENHHLISLDYSQIELRILAEMADIQALQAAFQKGADIHAMTAAQVFGLTEEQVTPELRRQAKAINFGIIYGISAFGLARQLQCSNTEAKEFITLYFKHFPGIQDFMEKCKQECRQTGYVTTMFGRKLFINGINDKNPMRRNHAERQAINAPIQGTAADIIKRAMIKIPSALTHHELGDVIMLLQVHDELIFEAPIDKVDKAITVVKAIMEGASLPKIAMKVPLKVEAGHGLNWHDAH